MKSLAVAALQPASVQRSIVVGAGDALIGCATAIRCYPAIRRYAAGASHGSRSVKLASIESAGTMLTVIRMEICVVDVVHVAIVVVVAMVPVAAIVSASPVPATVVNTAIESDA